MNLNKISLADSSHFSPKEGTCLMEAISVITGDTFGDHPKCVARPIADFGIMLNDMATSTKMRNKYLRPLIPCLINTAKLETIEIKLNSLRHSLVNQFTSVGQNEGHNRKIQKFLYKKLKEAFGNAHVEWPDAEIDRKAFQTKWKTCVGILRAAAAYARELLGPSHDAPECCTPEFLAMLKPAQEPVQTAIKTDA